MLVEGVLYSLPGSIPHRGGGGPVAGGTLGPWDPETGPPGPEIARPPHRQICRWGVRKQESRRKVELRCKQKGKNSKVKNIRKTVFFCGAFCLCLSAVFSPGMDTLNSEA